MATEKWVFFPAPHYSHMGHQYSKTHVLCWNNTGLKWLYALVLASSFFKKNSIKKSNTALQKNKSKRKKNQTNKNKQTNQKKTPKNIPDATFNNLFSITDRLFLSKLGTCNPGSNYWLGQSWQCACLNIRKYLKISNFKQTKHKALIL